MSAQEDGVGHLKVEKIEGIVRGELRCVGGSQEARRSVYPLCRLVAANNSVATVSDGVEGAA